MHVDEEKWDAGLLEKYVLGLCTASEKKQVESLIADNPDLADKLQEMHKALKCYCTTCYSDKVKSILRGHGGAMRCQSAKEDTRMVNLGMEAESSTLLRRLTSLLRGFFPF